MSLSIRAILLSGLMVSSLGTGTPTYAAPVTPGNTIGDAHVRMSVQDVRWRGHGGGWRHHRGWGWGGVGAGIVGGAIVGSLLAPRYYDGDGYYGRRYYYSGSGDDAVAYCSSRFRSYDPASGTYLGYDGIRHPCP